MVVGLLTVCVFLVRFKEGAALPTRSTNVHETAHETILKTLGQTAILHCIVTADRNAVVEWYFQDGNEVLTQGRLLQTLDVDKRQRYTVSKRENFNLQITNIQQKDVGTYVCRQVINALSYSLIATRILYADKLNHNEAPVLDQKYPEYFGHPSEKPSTEQGMSAKPKNHHNRPPLLASSGRPSADDDRRRGSGQYDALSVFGLLSGIALMVGIVGSIAWKNGKKRGRKQYEKKNTTESIDTKVQIPLKSGRIMKSIDSDPNLVKASGYK